MARILIIDDERGVRSYLSMVLGNSGHATVSSSLLREGLKKCEEEEFDIVLLDVQLPDGNGLDALPLIQNSAGRPEVIIITGEGDPDGAELAIKSGAWDYIEKPLLIESILLPVNRALLYHNEKQSTPAFDTFNRQTIIGASPQLDDSINIASRAASGDFNTLITGETGTGKELFARAIHQNSSRREKDFVVVDCTALPETLVESILFGHERGAFTGADKSRDGLVGQADKGTLFLDEVGDLPFSTQKTFLRVLQEKKFRPVGCKKEKKSDFRLISATNRNLEALVTQGKFRQDLLFRLRNINLDLPPLRNREGDIHILATHFIGKFCELHELPGKTMSDELLAAMCFYNWPGNIRELISVLENVLLAAGKDTVLYPDHLPVSIRAQIAKFSIKPKEEKNGLPVHTASSPRVIQETYKEYREKIFYEAEKNYLVHLMDSTEWDIKTACSLSGLSRSRLYTLLKKHSISR